MLFFSDAAVEARVADDPPDPIVEPPAHIARARVGVPGGPAAEEDPAHIRPVIPIGVLQEEGVGSLVDNETSAREAEAGGDAQLVGEDGELVGPAVAIGVFADLDPIFSLALGLDLVGVVSRFADPQATADIPGHGDRLGDVGLGREELRLETFRQHHVLLRLRGGDRLLHPVELLAERSPAPVGQVVWKLGAPEFERLEPPVRFALVRNGEFARSRAPADSTLHELVKSRVLPGALVMAPGSIEDPALAAGANPGPGFPALAFSAGLQEGAILFVVVGVHIGLIPALKALETLHDGMVRLDVADPEDTGSMALELGAHERDVLRRVEETIGGAVQGNEALAAVDEVEKGFFLLRADLADVGVDDEAVVRSQLVRVQVFDPAGVLDIDSARLQHGDQLRGAVERAVMPIVTEEENGDAFFGGAGSRG